MGVKISLGQQPCPWVPEYHLWPKEHRMVLVLYAQKNTTLRIRMGVGYRMGGDWVVAVSATLLVKNIMVVAWLPSDKTCDMDRVYKAIKWTEKSYGLLKIKSAQLWFTNFLDAWSEQPWV